MSTGRKGPRFPMYLAIVAIAGLSGWQVVKPWLQANPAALSIGGPVRAMIDGVPYAGEIEVKMSEDPFRLHHEVIVSIRATGAAFEEVASDAPGSVLLRMDHATGEQHVRLVDVQSKQVVADGVRVDWQPLEGEAVAPVSWVGNRLLLWPDGSGPRPGWREDEQFIVSLGRQYYLAVYIQHAIMAVLIAAVGCTLVVVGTSLMDRRRQGS